MASRPHARNDGDASIDEQAPNADPQGTLRAATRDVAPTGDMEALLGAYLVGTRGVTLGKRLDLTHLPEACLKYVLQAKSAGRVWVAWSTEKGPMAAWADYDGQRSERMRAHVLLVEWWDPLSGHHALWARSDPRRPTEWTFGRGHD
jgi:hypothetical protein